MKVSHPNFQTADDDTLLQLMCQSTSLLSNTSSTLLIEWLSNSILLDVKKSIPDSQTADGKKLLQRACQSKKTVSRISSVVLSNWLRNTTIHINSKNFKLQWMTADGDTVTLL